MSDKIYYNANLYNDKAFTIEATYTETKTVPIIDKRKDYYMSVIRFSCPTSTIPIFFYKPNANYLTLSVGNTNYVTLEIPYKTYIRDANLPLDNSINLENRGRYFYYQQFIDGINETLQTLINSIAIPAGTTLPIKFFYDRNADAVDFIFPKIYVTNNIRFYISANLYPKFLSFPSYELLEPVPAPNIDIEIRLYEDVNNDFNTNYYINSQASSIFYWYEWNKVIIKSYNMGINGENNSAIENGNPISEFILTDYEISNSVTKQALTSLLYNPTAQYRLASFLDESPLRTIDYKIFIQFKSGFLYSLELLPGESVNMKILFTKKSSENYK